MKKPESNRAMRRKFMNLPHENVHCKKYHSRKSLLRAMQLQMLKAKHFIAKGFTVLAKEVTP